MHIACLLRLYLSADKVLTEAMNAPSQNPQAKLPATGQVVPLARRSGFYDAHDFLVHLNTGQCCVCFFVFSLCLDHASFKK